LSLSREAFLFERIGIREADNVLILNNRNSQSPTLPEQQVTNVFSYIEQNKIIFTSQESKAPMLSHEIDLTFLMLVYYKPKS